jgi:uncharacterized protein
MGFSMGGEEAIGASRSNGAVRAVVAEGATGRTAADKDWLSDVYGWRGHLQEIVEDVQYRITDYLSPASTPVSLERAVRDSDAEFLIISAGAVTDEGHVAETLGRAAPERVETWTVDAAGHTGGLDTDPEEWVRRVTGFLDSTVGSG